MTTTPPLPGRDLSGYDALYGLEIDQLGDAEVTARVAVRDELRQPAGLIHGGVLASIADTTTTLATALVVEREGKVAHAISNQTSFLRPLTGDTIHASARRRHRGRTTWVWEVELTDDEGRLCALVRMTIAVRPAS